MKLGRCRNCDYITEVKEYPQDWTDLKIDLCLVCSNTFLSRASSYNVRLDQGDIYLYKSIGYLTNTIIDILDLRERFNQSVNKQHRLDSEL